MTKKKKNQSVIDTLTQTLTESVSGLGSIQGDQQKTDKNTKYVVLRDNKRVSDIEYEDPQDPAAIAERDFWLRVVSKYPDGTKISITKYNNKIHRVYGEIN